VARRLRSDGLRARVIGIKLKLARRERAGPRGYPVLTRRKTLGEPTDDGAAIARTAIGLLHGAGLSEPLRLIGVVASGLAATSTQLDLLPPSEETARRRRLNGALDEIADRFGDTAVVRGRPQERAGLTQQKKRGDSRKL
jgi:DNA polymerase IV